MKIFTFPEPKIPQNFDRCIDGDSKIGLRLFYEIKTCGYKDLICILTATLTETLTINRNYIQETKNLNIKDTNKSNLFTTLLFLILLRRISKITELRGARFWDFPITPCREARVKNTQGGFQPGCYGKRKRYEPDPRGFQPGFNPYCYEKTSLPKAVARIGPLPHGTCTPPNATPKK